MSKKYTAIRLIDLPKGSEINYENNGEWVVRITERICGERTSAYDSEPDFDYIRYPFSGTLSDCYAWIQLFKR